MENLFIKTKNFKRLSEIFNTNQCLPIIAGPCVIESYEQMDSVAQTLVKNNVKFIRGGAYKPRTSPYDFQGLGLDGLKILDDIRKKYNLLAVSEIMDPRDIENGVKYTDVIQIGSRNMYNYSLLKEAGQTNHPILLKRGMMATIEEFTLSAEYLVYNGTENLILCERGIRTFENSTRNTLDLTCVAIVKETTSIPIIVDLSHSLGGRKDILLAISKSILAIEADGIMLELTEYPDKALSDAKQQLNFIQFTEFICNLFKNGD